MPCVPIVYTVDCTVTSRLIHPTGVNTQGAQQIHLSCNVRITDITPHKKQKQRN